MLNTFEKHALDNIKVQLYTALNLLTRLMGDTVETASIDETRDMVRLFNRITDTAEFMDERFNLEAKCATDR